MRKIIVGTLASLPLAVISIPTQASVLNVGLSDGFHRSVQQEPIIIAACRRVRVPARWEIIDGGRRLVPAHWETIC